MSFFRPDALGAVLRWREAMIGLGAAGLGAWWIWSGSGLLRWVGVAFVLGGLSIAREGLARARRPGDGGGPGLVEVDERQIAFLSGLGGGAVSLEALTRVAVRRDAERHVWILDTDMGRLSVPGDAVGAAQIFDALAVLPGLTHERALAATSGPEGTTVLWRRADRDGPVALH